MPRRPRLELPDTPLHVTQRGINKGAIFLDAEDRYHFRRLLHTAFRDHGIALHAFVLMDNHFHLLLTPETVGRLSRAMGWIGQSYVQAFNLRHGRCGALWQGRFTSCLVQSERYLLTVMRYIELNPVRAARVDAPESYRWSSVHTPGPGARSARHNPPALPRHGTRSGRTRHRVQTMARRWHRPRRPATPSRICQPRACSRR